VRGDGLAADEGASVKSNWRRQRDLQRERERAKYAALMHATYGAPDDCELVPFDCVLLEQSICQAGNVPPAWIVKASRAWLAANNVSVDQLKVMP
jgi:hypothetical protein